jgi:hypothetical protein
VGMSGVVCERGFLAVKFGRRLLVGTTKPTPEKIARVRGQRIHCLVGRCSWLRVAVAVRILLWGISNSKIERELG